jgi:hypothetical protein
MATGRKTGGRKAGTPNRKTGEIGELLEALGCNPIEGMAKIAQNLKNSAELRGRMYAELAQYVYPKRKAVEQSFVDAEGRDRPVMLSDIDRIIAEAEAEADSGD